jgi:multidrug efflux system outer membrane protein
MSRADLLPSIRNDNAWSRYRTSGNAPSPIGVPVESFLAEEWRVPFDLSYEIDVWGRVRRGFESARERALGAEAARQNILLTLQADIAANYFNLIGVNEEIRTYQDAIELRREALTLFERRLEVGVGTEFQVERTKVELATAEADLAAARRRRAGLRNALAVLCGRPPSGFDTATADSLTNAPAIAPGLPSALLERRPDVAEAERELAARNARIGVAQAAFFPSISLTANGGLQSGELEDLLDWDSRIWGIGPTVSVPVFQGGRLKADLDEARAAYEEAVANYRQSILVAFRDVDDSLAAVRFLREQSEALQRAVDASRNAVRLAFDRYSAGTVNFLEVIDAEGERLQNELARIQVATEQLTATVRLIKALGGGWEEPSATL